MESLVRVHGGAVHAARAENPPFHFKQSHVMTRKNRTTRNIVGYDAHVVQADMNPLIIRPRDVHIPFPSTSQLLFSFYRDTTTVIDLTHSYV